ncbi:IS66 family transposase [Vibrio casei]|nr:IS66 family transposase [Vibrio casei]
MPLVNELKAALLSQAVLHADETPLKVIKADNSSNYMWVIVVVAILPFTCLCNVLSQVSNDSGVC